MEQMRPRYRGAEDEEFCGAYRIYAEDRTKEESEDYILPDYLPDVKKIVAVLPETTVRNRFLGSGTLEYDGETRFKVLYIAEDGTLKSVVFTCGFEDKIGSSGFSEDCVEILTPVLRGLNVRLINPRKLNIRRENGAIVEVYKRICTMPALSGASAADEERLVSKVQEVPSMNVLTLSENGLSISEDLSFDPALPTAEELLYSSVLLRVEDCRPASGEVQLRGNAKILCICSSLPDAAGKTELIKLSKEIPFTQTVKNKGLHADGVCRAALGQENAELRLREDEFGQKRVIEVDVGYRCDLEVFYPKAQKIVSDVFSTERMIETDRSEKRFEAPDGVLKGSFSVNESVDLDLPEDGSYTLEYCFCRPELKGQKDDSGRIALGGSCSLTMLLRDGAGDLDVRRSSLPVRFVTDLAAKGEDVSVYVDAGAASACFRLDKKKLSADLEVCFYGAVCHRESVEALDAIRVLPEKRALTGKRGSLIFYYPDENEDLFSIAKKYGVDPQTLEGQTTGDKAPLYVERK